MLLTINNNYKKVAIAIMQKALAKNPNLSWMTRDNKWKLYNFHCFCLKLARLHNGAFLNSDHKGLVLFYKRGGRDSFIQRIKKFRAYLAFVVFAIDITKLFRIYSLQRTIWKYQPKSPHLYCLIIAVDPDEKSTQTIIGLRDYLFKQSQAQQLPIYIQTSVRRNKLLFERYGFHCYKKLKNEDANYTLWLLKRAYERA